MNRQQWKLFYGRLRQLARRGGGVNMFPADFNTALLYAMPAPSQRFALWADGRLKKLWLLALQLYPTTS
jgi:hypothetical protein